MSAYLCSSPCLFLLLQKLIIYIAFVINQNITEHGRLLIISLQNCEHPRQLSKFEKKKIILA